MKLGTRKFVSFFTACLIICFSIVSFFGIHSRWGYTVNNYVKGWQNLRFGFDFDNHTEMTLKPVDKNANLNDESIIDTIQSRLNFMGLTDNKIDVDPADGLLTLKFTQPAGHHDFDAQTVVDLVGLKGDFAIFNSDEAIFPDDIQEKIGRSEIKSVKLIAQNDDLKTNKNAPQKHGIEIQLTEAGTDKLKKITQSIISSNEAKKKRKKADDKNKPEASKLEINLNGLRLSSQPVSAPIENGKIEIFNDSDFEILKQNMAFLKSPELPSSFSLKQLRTVSPEVGMWFKRSAALILIIVFLATILILITKFKLIGLACSVCLMGHAAFILACFTGFFSLYPGEIFNFGAFIGTLISLTTGILSCFLISKKIQNQACKEDQAFSLAVKKGSRSAGKLISSLNLKMIIGALVLMAFFSCKSNLVHFALQPIYDLLDIEMSFNGTISSIAYAILVGSIGTIIFEVMFIKYILAPVTSDKLKFVNFKNLFKNLKFADKNNFKKNKLKKEKPLSKKTSKNK